MSHHFYRAFLLATGLGMVGLILDLRSWWFSSRRDSQRVIVLVLLVLILLANLAAIVQYNQTYSQAQGRFLFPSIAAIAVLLIEGWSALVSRLGAMLLSGSRIRLAMPSMLAALVLVGLIAANFYALDLVYDAYW